MKKIELNPTLQDWIEYLNSKYCWSNESGATGGITPAVIELLLIANGYLKENEYDLGVAIFERNIYKNGSNSKDGYLWEERFDDDTVKNIQKKLNSHRRFASQYLNRIITEEEQVFKMEEANWLVPSMVEIQPGLVIVTHSDGKKLKVRPIICVDPAASTHKTNDRTAVAVGGVDEAMNLYVFDWKAGFWNSRDTTKAVYDLAKKYSTARVYVERNGVGAYLPDILKDAASTQGKVLYIIDHNVDR